VVIEIQTLHASGRGKKCNTKEDIYLLVNPQVSNRNHSLQTTTVCAAELKKASVRAVAIDTST
jgi:predicted metalloprotease